MPAPTRRTALQVAGGLLAAGLPGCLGLGSGDPPDLGQLEATNHDDEAHAVHVLFVEGGEPTYWNSKRLAAATEDVVRTATFEGYPTDTANTTLYARADRRSDWASFEFAAHDASCLGLSITLGEPRAGTGEGGRTPPGGVSVWYTTDTDVCDPSTGTRG
ncbi:hypothetical protein [Haloplanus halophilus]|uniref:hypothetical protein n=1 Tax=Haloplanus halophilus TaxID=2949993 RepID=UPI00203D4D03|nr:hypothetical protein [Haloplanus sp. GDY1]